jgi:hypothetical protein
MTPLRLYGVMAGGTALLAWGVVHWVRSHRKTPEQIERERRLRLSQRGRICDGTVIDVQELPSNGSDPAQFLIYTYEIGGVAYEASQDITQLRPFIDLHSCKLGLPTSIKYDPQNPGDSIVIAEEWTGLRA